MNHDDTVKALLANRHTAILEVAEPWPGMTAEGNMVCAPMLIRTTVEHAITIQRYKHHQSGHPIHLTDHELLDEFIVCQWAYVVDPGS